MSQGRCRLALWILDLGGLHDFTDFAFPKRAPYVARLPEFGASLAAIDRAELQL